METKNENTCLFKLEKTEEGLEISIQGSAPSLISAVAAAIDANENIRFVLHTALLLTSVSKEADEDDESGMNMDEALASILENTNIGKA
jgi:hypothetical protein